MGMFDRMPQVEQSDPSAPMPQGMMGGQAVAPMPQGDRSSVGYNGIVLVDGGQVPVSKGVADVGGKKYLVSDDGSIVIDQDRRIVGYVEAGQFKPMDAQHAALLKSKGVTE